MEYVVALAIYGMIVTYLLGKFTESSRLTEGEMSLPVWVALFGTCLFWPILIVWYIYDRITNR